MRVLSLLLVVLVAACGPAAVSTTTVGTTTSTSTTTTSTVAPTSSTSTAPTTTVSAIEGVPEEALALIGAEMPEPDLTISEASEEEVRRWLMEWSEWNRWLGANPDRAVEVLEVGLVPGTDFFDTAAEEYADQAANDARLLGGRIDFVSVEPGSESFAGGSLFVVAQTRRATDGFLLAEGSVERVLAADPDDALTTLHFFLTESGEGKWRLERFERPSQG